MLRVGGDTEKSNSHTIQGGVGSEKTAIWCYLVMLTTYVPLYPEKLLYMVKRGHVKEIFIATLLLAGKN